MKKAVRIAWIVCICLCFSACGGKAPAEPKPEEQTLSMSAEKLWEAGMVAIDMKDYEKALRYYQMSAEKGYVKAWKALGSLYYFGDGVEQSYDKAAEYFLLAADQGLADSQVLIGSFYLLGYGVEKSSDKAAEYFILAANQGNEDAIAFLSLMQNQGER